MMNSAEAGWWHDLWTAYALIPLDPDGTSMTVRSNLTNGEATETAAGVSVILAPAVVIYEAAKAATEAEELEGEAQPGEGAGEAKRGGAFIVTEVDGTTAMRPSEAMKRVKPWDYMVRRWALWRERQEKQKVW